MPEVLAPRRSGTRPPRPSCPPEPSVVMEVRTDSLEEEGIRRGDLLVVVTDRDPQPGDTVVVEVDGDTTVGSYGRPRPGAIELTSTRRGVPPLVRPPEEVAIVGVLAAVLRTY